MEQMYLAKIRVKHPDFKLKKLQEMLNFDTILSAQESVDLGLADKILGEE
jgi:ATP-dependent protease ClpP protease subunit